MNNVFMKLYKAFTVMSTPCIAKLLLFLFVSKVSINMKDNGATGAGAVGATAGAVGATAGTIGLVSASGSVAGLSAAGITSGLAAIGGGTMVGGIVVAAAAPVAAAAVVGGAAYWLWNQFYPSKLHNFKD